MKTYVAPDGTMSAVGAQHVEASNKDGGPSAPSFNLPYDPTYPYASVSQGSIEGANRVVHSMIPDFRQCYRQALVDDPTMKGTVRIKARIGPTGAVSSAAPIGGGGLSRKVEQCCVGAVKSRTFPRPESGTATLIIPVSFQPQ